MRLFGRKEKISREPSPDRDSSPDAPSGRRKPKRNLKERLGDKNRWYWKFAQQQLPGWAPILTANWVVLYFLAVTAVCLAIGIPVLIASLNIKEYSVRYDNVEQFAGQSRSAQSDILLAQNGNGVELTADLLIRKSMLPPIYVFYELQKYYQNHKRYVRSRADNQMAGQGSDASSCEPERYIDGSLNPSLPNNGIIDPCGLIAWSFFNDTYSLADSSGNTVAVDESGIAWSYDRNHLYGPVQPQNFNTEPALRGGNTSTEVINRNEHLMVWLRPGAKPTIRKLWGRINTPLAAGTTIRVTVQNRYDTYRWGGAKKLILSTNSWVGGRNLFLGIIYLVVAGLAFLAALGFLFCYHLGFVGRRRFGDLNRLSWNRKQ